MNRRQKHAPVLSLLVVVVGFAVPGAVLAQNQPPANQPPANQPASGDETTATESAAGASANAADQATSDESGDGATADIDTLRQEYLRLRDQLFRSRARAAAVASALYSTKLQVFLNYDSGRFYTVTRATVRLDGASVFDDTSGAVASDNVPRFDGFVAPGRHQVSVRIEATGKDDERFASIVDNTFTVQAPAGADVILRIRARDDGDIPYAWRQKQRGSYKLLLDVAVETRARPDGDAGGKPGDSKSGAKPEATRVQPTPRSGPGHASHTRRPHPGPARARAHAKARESTRTSGYTAVGVRQ